jgi:hypothetical protein
VAPLATPSREELIDEFGELNRQVQLFQSKADRHEFLKKLIRSWFDNDPAGEIAVATGHVYEVQFTPKAKERPWTDMFKLYRALGRTAFLSICEVALGEAEKLLGEIKVASLVTEALSGSRRLKRVVSRTPVVTQA